MTDAPILEPRDILGINVIRIRDGRAIRIEDIETADQGRIVLNEIDASILAIEDQIDHIDLSTHNGREWKKRAERALKVKRRSRPTLQARIGELARAEKASAIRATHARDASKVDAKRRVFIQAAYEVLGHETCIEIWARAQEKEPTLFAGGGDEP